MVQGDSLAHSAGSYQNPSGKGDRIMNSTRWIAAGGAVMALGYLLDYVCGVQRQKHKETQLDDALDGTYPASDPTATQDFAIPVNRL
jgi:hypothetical protein